METRDRVVLVLTSTAVLAGTVGGLLISVPVGLFVLCGLLLAIALLIVFSDEGEEAVGEPQVEHRAIDLGLPE